jgi:four helix bundle protein
MYTDLRSFQQAEVIYDFTVEFSKMYVDKFSRTTDQMEQAARSGKQNIAEGCSVGRTDPKGEVKLLEIARASLKELLEDYEDYLRQHKLEIWSKDDPRAIAVRQLAYRSDKSDKSDRSDRTDKSDRSYRTYMTYYFIIF